MGYLGFDGASRRNLYDMELGYDNCGSSPMLSATPSSTAPSRLHMPLPMYVPLTNFYGMNSPCHPSSVPLPIPIFFWSYSAPGIALPSLPTLSRPVLPVGSIIRPLPVSCTHIPNFHGSNKILGREQPPLGFAPNFLIYFEAHITNILPSPAPLPSLTLSIHIVSRHRHPCVHNIHPTNCPHKLYTLSTTNMHADGEGYSGGCCMGLSLFLTTFFLRKMK